MSEIKKAADAIKDAKRVKDRVAASTDKLATVVSAIDAGATKMDAMSDGLSAEEKEMTALLTELGSNFGPDEPEAAPAKKGLFGK